jgi:hypothetical protein
MACVPAPQTWSFVHLFHGGSRGRSTSTSTRKTTDGQQSSNKCGEVVELTCPHLGGGGSRGSLGISTDCSKEELKARDKKKEKKTTTSWQTRTMWTRTTLKMNFQWVPLVLLWSRGREKKGGSCSAEVQLYHVHKYLGR